MGAETSTWRSTLPARRPAPQGPLPDGRGSERADEVDAAIEQVTAWHPDLPEYTGRMARLTGSVRPVKGTPVVTYIHHLYHLARLWRRLPSGRETGA